MKIIVGDKKVLQRPRTHMVLWTTGKYGRQRIKMKLDTHIIRNFSEELRCSQCINILLLVTLSPKTQFLGAIAPCVNSYCAPYHTALLLTK